MKLSPMLKVYSNTAQQARLCFRANSHGCCEVDVIITAPSFVFISSKDGIALVSASFAAIMISVDEMARG